MNCEHLQANLFDYLDGALSASDQTALEKHLAECPDCRAALRQESQLAQSLSGRLEQAVETVALDPLAQRNVARAMERAVAAESQARPAGAFWHRLVWPLGAVAAAMLLLIAFGLEHHLGAQLSLPAPRHPEPPAHRELLVHVSDLRPGYIFRMEGNQVIDALTTDPLVVDATLTVPN